MDLHLTFPFIWVTVDSDLRRSNPKGFLSPREAKDDLDRVRTERAAWRKKLNDWTLANPAPVVINPVRPDYPSLGSVPESDSAFRLREANQMRLAQWHTKRSAYLQELEKEMSQTEATTDRIWYRVAMGEVTPEDHLVAHDLEEESGLTKR